MVLYKNHDINKEIISEQYSLFLDDIRTPLDVKGAWHREKWEQGFPSLYNWVVVRDYNEFVKCITQYKCPIRVSFDHDLAWDHYPKEDLSLLKNKSINYNAFKEKTGYHCAQWLVEYCLDQNIELPDFYVHSMNPVGRNNIISLLTSFLKVHKVKNNVNSHLI